MESKIFSSVETGAIVGGTLYGLTNLQTILGILILVINLGLIIYKIIQAIRKSKTTGDMLDVENSLQESIDILEKLQETLPKIAPQEEDKNNE